LRLIDVHLLFPCRNYRWMLHRRWASLHPSLAFLAVCDDYLRPLSISIIDVEDANSFYIGFPVPDTNDYGTCAGTHKGDPSDRCNDDNDWPVQPSIRVRSLCFRVSQVKLTSNNKSISAVIADYPPLVEPILAQHIQNGNPQPLPHGVLSAVRRLAMISRLTPGIEPGGHRS